MKTLYALGIFSASLLLIQIEAIIITCVYAIFWHLGLEFLGQLCCIVLSVIVILGHVITTYNSVGHIVNSEIDFDTLLKELYKKNKFFNNPVQLGVMWRFTNEWKNIKKVANLDFKKEENKV